MSRRSQCCLFCVLSYYKFVELVFELFLCSGAQKGKIMWGEWERGGDLDEQGGGGGGRSERLCGGSGEEVGI